MSKKIDVILLCGGRGTRFREITRDEIPKPLYKLSGTELINFSIASFDFSLINKLIFAVDHHAPLVETWVNEQKFPVDVIVSQQKEPGIYGAVNSALRYVTTDDFLVSSTDEVREGFSLQTLLEVHGHSSQTLATMMLAPTAHLYRHRVISTNDKGIVVGNELLNEKYRLRPNLVKMVHAGYVIYRKEAIPHFDSLMHDTGWNALIDHLIDERLMRGVAYPNVTYFNVGTPVELDDALSYFGQDTLDSSMARPVTPRMI